MSRNVLLVEPNYKNKYPPMGLMKLSTYFKMCGDNVRFFKGDLKDLVIDLETDKLIENISILFPATNWKLFKRQFVLFLKKSQYSAFENNEIILGNQMVLDFIKEAKERIRNGAIFDNPPYDFVGITTLFTFYWDITIETINFAKKLCKKDGVVQVGGVAASILPSYFLEATGIQVHEGLLNHPGDIDKDNKLIIDTLPLDYSILDEIEYEYPAKDAYYGYMTRGCINHCAFCAVPKLEPQYCSYISIKEQIKTASEKYGEMKDLLLLDNNVLASKDFEKIIDEIKEAGFAKGATYIPPDKYSIAIRNLKGGINDRAYVKQLVSYYRLLMDKLPEDLNAQLYSLLKSKGCLDTDTATKEDLLSLDDFVAPLNEQYMKVKTRRKRIVDFNQGIDARLINDYNMSKLSEINIEPLRIAFDHVEQTDIYCNAVRTAVKHGIRKLSNYMLYNFQDTPDDLYKRMAINQDLCEELKADIYSFPMKYHPIDDPEYFSNRDYIGENWNRKFVRAVQAVLNAKKGAFGRGKEFFEEAFGRDLDRFHTILWMPEAFIIYRFKFKDNLAKEWENSFNGLAEGDLEIVKKIVATDSFANLELSKYKPEITKVLRFYKITRDQAAKMKV